MRDLQARRTIRKITSSPITVIVLVVPLLFVGRAAWLSYEDFHASKIQFDAVRAEVLKLEDRQRELSEANTRLETEEGVEEEIREKFRMGREGESLIVIVGDHDSGEDTKQSVSLWSRIQNWFGF